MTSVANIEKLCGENFATWSVQMKSLLITQDLWDTVESDCPKNPEEQLVWKKGDQKALATIILSVKSSELIHIKSCATAKCAWNTLSGLYKANTACRKVNLFKSLVRFKFNPGEKISSQIGEFRGIVDDMKNIGVELNEDLVAVLLLCALPEEMENFVVAVESRDELPKMNQLISKVLEEERRQSTKNDGHEDRVFSASEKYRQPKSNCTSHSLDSKHEKYNKKTTNNYERVGKRNSFKCYKCGKSGHFRSQCKSNERESIAFVLSIT